MALPKQNKKAALYGFTIVELLVVIVVIGILVTIGVIAFNGVSMRATTAVLQSDLRTASKKIESEKVINSDQYPSTEDGQNVVDQVASEGTVFQYTNDDNENTYQLSVTSATNDTIAGFHLTSDDPDIDEGVWSGHDSPIAQINGGVVTTLAGSGAATHADGAGVAASFEEPANLDVDADGNVYVSDYGNDRIRIITSSGIVTTLAGSSASGSTNGTGANARFDRPNGMAIDQSGNLYIGDYGNSRLRKIEPGGIVTTLAGFSQGFVDNTGSIARFRLLHDVAVDSGGVIWVADQGNDAIRRVSPAGEVTTIAGATEGFVDGTGAAAQFNSPRGIAVDSEGNLYVTDGSNHAIRRVTPAGIVTTIAGSGVSGFNDATGSAAQFNTPRGIVVANDGTLYVADSANNRIRMVTPEGVVTTLAGSGVAGYNDATGAAAQFDRPYGIAIDGSGTLYVSDFDGNRIRKIE